MNVAQLEYADQYSDPLPANDMIDRMRMLCLERESALERLEKKEAALRAIDRMPWGVRPAQRAKLANEADQVTLLVRTLQNEIVEVARLIVAEADNGELITERNTE